jgi:nucleoside-diphosphate-sugar epimerase
MRAHEPARCVADTAALRALGWHQRIALDAGLADLVAAERVIMKAIR